MRWKKQSRGILDSRWDVQSLAHFFTAFIYSITQKTRSGSTAIDLFCLQDMDLCGSTLACILRDLDFQWMKSNAFGSFIQKRQVTLNMDTQLEWKQQLGLWVKALETQLAWHLDL